MYNYGNPEMYGSNYGWSYGMGLISILFLVLLIVIIIHFARGHHTHEEIAKQNPLDIVNERYAKGEITKIEFEQYKKDLK